MTVYGLPSVCHALFWNTSYIFSLVEKTTLRDWYSDSDLQTRKLRGMQDPAQHPRAAELLTGEARSRPGGHRRALTAAAAEPDRMQGRNRATHQGHWIQPDAPGSCSMAGSVRS